MARFTTRATYSSYHLSSMTSPNTFVSALRDIKQKIMSVRENSIFMCLVHSYQGAVPCPRKASRHNESERNKSILLFLSFSLWHPVWRSHGIVPSFSALCCVKTPTLDCTLMVHLHVCLPERCGQKIHKSKGDRQCKIGKKTSVFFTIMYYLSAPVRQTEV